jgi:hypothetical protein
MRPPSDKHTQRILACGLKPKCLPNDMREKSGAIATVILYIAACRVNVL